MEKQCTKCKELKLLDEFRKRKNSKDGYNQICKLCSSNYGKEHYIKNKENYISKSIKWKEKEKQKFISFLSNKQCIDCGESNIVTLEFDHKEDKKFNISDYIGRITFEKLMIEINKCDIVCANCHKKRTAKTFNWKKGRLV